MMSPDYQLPPLPLGGTEATVLRWLRQPGDSLSAGDPLLVVVNDRAEFVLPALAAGILDATLAAEGASVAVGVPLARIGAGQPAAAIAQPLAAPRRISPVARRIAEMLNIDIKTIAGSGPGGRILKRDILALLDDGRPTTDHRQLIVDDGQQDNLQSAITLTAIEVDLSQVAAVRGRMQAGFARRGLDATNIACVALVAVEALLRYPLLNSFWSDAGIVLRRRVHLGISLPDGQSTLVVAEAQDLNLRGLARAMAERAGAPKVDEPSGCTFTIASLGAGALWLGAPLISPPQSTFLSVGAIVERPLVIAESGVDRIVVRPTTVLTLAYDARLLDQCHADAFLRDVKDRLECFSTRSDRL